MVEFSKSMRPRVSVESDSGFKKSCIHLRTLEVAYASTEGFRGCSGVFRLAPRWLKRLQKPPSLAVNLNQLELASGSEEFNKSTCLYMVANTRISTIQVYTTSGKKARGLINPVNLIEGGKNLCKDCNACARRNGYTPRFSLVAITDLISGAF
jgi:hypothetical protein